MDSAPSSSQTPSLSENEGKSHEPRETLVSDLEAKETEPVERFKDTNTSRGRIKWWQPWRAAPIPPAPSSLEEASEIPLAKASLFSKLTLGWVTPIMTLGYKRPLQATDLWKMDSSRESSRMAILFLESWEKRQRVAEAYNSSLDAGTVHPSWLTRFLWALQCAIYTLYRYRSQRSAWQDWSKRMDMRKREWRKCGGRKRASVVWALNDCLDDFWRAGAFKVLGDVSQLMTPLVTKALIRFAQEAYAAQQTNAPPPNIGKGIAMALGLFYLTVQASVCQHQFFFRSMASGVMARSALISALYQRALVLSPSARLHQPNSKLMTHISADLSRIDYCSQWFHACWTAPIQVTISLILSIINIGPSACLGFSLFILIAPLQSLFMKISLSVRKQSMRWTDARSKLLSELLGSMQIVKVFTYEIPFVKRLSEIRARELAGIRHILIIRAANQAIAYSVPVLAAVLSFVVYASLGNSLDPAPIFTALSYFLLLRQPMMYLPRALSSVTDAQNAFGRLQTVFEAEVAVSAAVVDAAEEAAIRVINATFQWTASRLGDDHGSKQSTTAPFRLNNLNITIPKGKLVAIVGPFGSGKSSLLQGLIGEMERLTGNVSFGGSTAYCQQSAWIQNATVRDNILFGQPWEEERYWRIIEKAHLMRDLELLADGDLTEIGEKGVNLSGGQKQRINIARALYFNAETMLFDDPLSAVDPHVGRGLFYDAIKTSVAVEKKSVVLVTHALHFLPEVDYIYTMQDGAIVEQGEYATLMGMRGEFYRLNTEFGGDGQQEPTGPQEATTRETSNAVGTLSLGVALTGTADGRIHVAETRKTGQVGWQVYMGYLRSGRAHFTLPLTILFAILMQGAQIISTFWITYWESDKFHRDEHFYMGIFGALGISQAVFTFLCGATLGVLAYLSSESVFKVMLERVLHCPMSVFDTQPLGRTLGLFGKDIDVIDNQLPDSLRQFVLTVTLVLGSVITISVFFHYFVPVVAVVLFGYWYFARFYRTSAREIKRIDGMLRSMLYSHFSESLTGVSTIRAYGETRRFVRDNAYYTDLQNRAYLLTVTTQRWLAIRLDFMGALMIFAVAVMVAKGGEGIGPSQVGLCLSYLITLVQTFSMMTRQSAEVENNMNSVERVLQASSESLPQEAAHVTSSPRGALWPSNGQIIFHSVEMSYRPGLQPVLRGISLHINGGEKIGIVGRTGAGKSSLTVALFRLAELTSGSIEIDGVDISQLGLNELRSHLSIIPQDPVLFSGTLRSNLDPFGLYTSDALLYDALKRSCLYGKEGSGEYSLDMDIASEGSNLSLGERSLINLARALVKDSPIVVLDEATASVDLETDAKIQETIRREFGGKTLLCIAHRLRTIVSWDRIVVMDAGEVAEFDNPLALYDKGGIFRSMCDRSSLSRSEIVAARELEQRAP